MKMPSTITTATDATKTAKKMTNISNTSRSKRSIDILIVSSDMPSHVYACAKIAKVLAAGGAHRVKVAAPEGPSMDCISRELSNQTKSIQVISAGSIKAMKQHINVRPVIDPNSWTALWRGITSPLKVANQANLIKEYQEKGTLHDTILRLIVTTQIDLVIPIHSAAATVCDAVEVAKTHYHKNIPCIIFSSLPYDPCIMMSLDNKSMWKLPRSITALPHVALYSSKKNASFFKKHLQHFWQYLDYRLIKHAWTKSSKDNNGLRQERGLSPIKNGWRGYMDGRYPVVTLGGTTPFEPPEGTSHIPSHVTCVSSLESSTKFDKDSSGLLPWLESTKDNGVIYVCFGTGTALSEQEMLNITVTLPKVVLRTFGPAKAPKVLLVQRPSEQERLKHVIEQQNDVLIHKTMSTYTNEFYSNSILRIQDVVSQSALLQSGYIRVFVSHFGFGSFTEGVYAGIPFIAYPSGLDQYANAQRAIDARIALRVNHGLNNLSEVVLQALEDNELLARSKSLAASLAHDTSSYKNLVSDCVKRIVKEHQMVKTKILDASSSSSS